MIINVDDFHKEHEVTIQETYQNQNEINVVNNLSCIPIDIYDPGKWVTIDDKLREHDRIQSIFKRFWQNILFLLQTI